MTKKISLIEKTIGERTDLYVTPNPTDAFYKIDDVEEFVPDEDLEDAVEIINWYLDEFTKEEIEKKMLEGLGSMAWWEDIDYDELITKHTDNFTSIEETKEWAQAALDDGSLIKVEYGYVFNPL